MIHYSYCVLAAHPQIKISACLEQKTRMCGLTSHEFQLSAFVHPERSRNLPASEKLQNMNKQISALLMIANRTERVVFY